MSIIKELLKLQDPTLALLEAETSVELKAVVDAFPKHHEKALSKLWGGKRLVWHGLRFFEDGDLGEAYIKAEEAAKEYIDNGYNADVNMSVDASSIVPEGEDDEDRSDGDVDFSFDAEFKSDEVQECYLGYDPKRDCLYIGFDAWTSEENFNDAWDKAFEDTTGEVYDSDNEEHAAVFHEAWEEYKSEGYGFWGLVFEIDKHFNCEEALPPMQGGFYKGTFELFKQNHPNVVHLRLD